MEPSTNKLAELTQSSFPFRSQTLVLYDDRLELTSKGPLERFRIPFYLQVLKEDPDLNLVFPWRGILLWACILGGGLTLALLGHRSADAPAGFSLAALGAAGLLCSLLMIRRIHVYFYKAAPGPDPTSVRYIPQLWVYPDRPSTEEVNRFQELLKIAREKHVEKAAIEHEEPIPYARELERFANLRKEEVLTEEEYVLVKAKLLNIKPRRIGF